MSSTPSISTLTTQLMLAVILVMCIASRSNTLQAQQSMSLEDCIAYALERHPQIKLAQLEIRDADWQIKENTAVALPQLNIGVDYQYFIQQPELPAEALGFPADPGTKFTFALRNNLTGTIGVNQLLFNNSYLLGIKAAKEYRKYVDIKLEAAKTALRNSVTDAYVPALILTENINILNKNLEVQEQLLYETREVYKAGFAEQLDVDRIEFASTTLQTERDNLVRQQEILVDLLQFASYGDHVGEAMQPLAANVQTVVIPGAGHWVAEEAPEEVLAALTGFLAPLAEADGWAHDTSSHAGAAS
jgi:outer membrane protein TolC